MEERPTPEKLSEGFYIGIDYFEGELCVSDNLENSRGTDKESELSSILIHPTLGSRHCQPAWAFKKAG